MEPSCIFRVIVAHEAPQPWLRLRLTEPMGVHFGQLPVRPRKKHLRNLRNLRTRPCPQLQQKGKEAEHRVCSAS